MLIIYTEVANDQVTQVLASYAKNFAAESAAASPICLDPQSYNQHSLVHDALRSNGLTKVVFFGHGRSRPPGLLAQDGNPWLDRENCDALAGRSLVAAACFSRNAIARKAMAKGASVVVGYAGFLYVPLSGPGVREMENSVLTVPSPCATTKTCGMPAN